MVRLRARRGRRRGLSAPGAGCAGSRRIQHTCRNLSSPAPTLRATYAGLFRLRGRHAAALQQAGSGNAKSQPRKGTQKGTRKGGTGYFKRVRIVTKLADVAHTQAHACIRTLACTHGTCMHACTHAHTDNIKKVS